MKNHCFASCHSRASGNPGLFGDWIPIFMGMTSILRQVSFITKFGIAKWTASNARYEGQGHLAVFGEERQARIPRIRKFSLWPYKSPGIVGREWSQTFPPPHKEALITIAAVQPAIIMALPPAALRGRSERLLGKRNVFPNNRIHPRHPPRRIAGVLAPS